MHSPSSSLNTYVGTPGSVVAYQQLAMISITPVSLLFRLRGMLVLISLVFIKFPACPSSPIRIYLYTAYAYIRAAYWSYLDLGSSFIIIPIQQWYWENYKIRLAKYRFSTVFLLSVIRMDYDTLVSWIKCCSKRCLFG